LSDSETHHRCHTSRRNSDERSACGGLLLCEYLIQIEAAVSDRMTQPVMWRKLADTDNST
jgi:hypothetical protein